MASKLLALFPNIDEPAKSDSVKAESDSVKAESDTVIRHPSQMDLNLKPGKGVPNVGHAKSVAVSPPSPMDPIPKPVSGVSKLTAEAKAEVNSEGPHTVSLRVETRVERKGGGSDKRQASEESSSRTKRKKTGK